MTPEQAIRGAKAGELRPIYLVVGEERWFADRVVEAVREAAAAGGIAGFNEDKFQAGEQSVDGIVAAARMAPMMAKQRFVLVRGLERWERKGDEGESSEDRGTRGAKGRDARAAGPLDQLAEYAKAPVPSTVMLLVASKLHGQRRLVTTAKKEGFIVTCDRLARRDLPSFILSMARDKGHQIDQTVADQLAEIAGPELGYIVDALERLSLYVGVGQPITDQAVAALVTRVRQSSVWELVDALGRRRLDRALATIADVYDGHGGGLPLLGAVTWSVRQLVKFESALATGAQVPEAAQRAGVPPFKANDLSQVVRAAPPGMLVRWLRLLSEADLALKGSRRPPEAVLETMLVDMCR